MVTAAAARAARDDPEQALDVLDARVQAFMPKKPATAAHAASEVSAKGEEQLQPHDAGRSLEQAQLSRAAGQARGQGGYSRGGSMTVAPLLVREAPTVVASFWGRLQRGWLPMGGCSVFPTGKNVRRIHHGGVARTHLTRWRRWVARWRQGRGTS